MINGKLDVGVAISLGILMLINGIFMTVAPESWYWLIPGVADRGPFNQHFVRDIGFIYALMGVAFIYVPAYARAHWRSLVLPAGWLICHAVFHVWEVIIGLCGTQALVEDFAGVILPALLAGVLIFRCYRSTAQA